MRNGQNKRMRGRNNHRKSHNPMVRVFESNGPDVKIRGNPSHIAEKYVQLARDALTSGDPIAAENYYQHAEHYYRVIAAAQEQFRQNNPHLARPENEGGGPREGGFDDGEDDGQASMSGSSDSPYGTREPRRDRAIDLLRGLDDVHARERHGDGGAGALAGDRRAQKPATRDRRHMQGVLPARRREPGFAQERRDLRARIGPPVAERRRI